MKKTSKNLIVLIFVAVIGVTAFSTFNHYAVSADTITQKKEEKLMPLSMAEFTSEDMNLLLSVVDKDVAVQVTEALGSATQEEYIRGFANKSPELVDFLKSEYGIYID